MRVVGGGAADKLRGHHRVGRGHGTRTGTLYARPNYCTGQPSAETPLHNRNRRGIRERTHGAGWCSEEVAGSRGQDTHERTKGLLWHQYTVICRVGVPGAYESVLGNNYLHTQMRDEGPSLPSGVGLHTTTATTTSENDSSTLQKHYTTKISDEIT